MTYELDVITTEFSEPDSAVPAGDPTMDGGVKTSLDAKMLIKGRLHLRMANVGHPSDGKLNKTGKFTLDIPVILVDKLF